MFWVKRFIEAIRDKVFPMFTLQGDSHHQSVGKILKVFWSFKISIYYSVMYNQTTLLPCYSKVPCSMTNEVRRLHHVWSSVISTVLNNHCIKIISGHCQVPTYSTLHVNTYAHPIIALQSANLFLF